MLRTSLNYWLVTEDIWPEAEFYNQAFTFNHVIAVVLGEIYVLALASSIKLTLDWTHQRQRIEKLKKEQLATELNLLKTQIQPHFFFNTLNNLYALTLQKSDLAPDIVIKLSNIMQYVIYDVKSNRVSIKKEIKYIHDYLDLEKIRYGDTLDFSLKIKGNGKSIKIPPLLFLTYIENIFKHGIPLNNSFYAKVVIKTDKDFILFESENSYSSEIKKTNKKKRGLGTKNAKRRLDLLYGNNYMLTTKFSEKKYKVKLKIPIKIK